MGVFVVSEPVSVKIDVKIGPATISYKSNPGDVLYVQDSEFISKVVELMKYVGSSEDRPAKGEFRVNNWVPEPVLGEPYRVAPATYVEPEPAPPAPTPAYVEEAADPAVLYDDDTSELPAGNRVSRVAGTSFALGDA